MRTCLLAFLLAGCTEEIGGLSLDHARARVEPSSTNTLATLDVSISMFGLDIAWEGTLIRAWLDDAYGAPLPVALTPERVHVPANASLDVPLANLGITNADLAPYCQTTVPFTAQIAMRDQDVVMQIDADLAVFCE